MSQPRPNNSADRQSRISKQEVEDVEERSAPRTPVIYEIVRRMGDEEMARPVTSLWWSGLAAGLSISFSLLAEAILRAHLPVTEWRSLVSSFGYSIGFIMVVLSRQQLFTEATITVVLPVTAEWSGASLARALRVWGVVLVANLVGTLFAATFCTFTPVVSPELRSSMLEVSQHILGHGFLEAMFRAVTSGFLIAAMVWLLPSSESGQLAVVAIMTYLIAAGDFMHIIAGSMEGFMLLLNGDAGLRQLAFEFLVPVLLGNIIGGTALFALLSYAQVMKEI